MHYI